MAASVMVRKYIEPQYWEDWICNPVKKYTQGSSLWKAIVLSFPLVGSFLAWKVGDGKKVRLGADPWIDGQGLYHLSDDVISTD